MRSLVFFSLLMLSSMVAAQKQPSGKGTADSPYLVGSPDELLWLSQQVNTGNQAVQKSTVALSQDIDLSGVEISSIGRYETNPFRGVFDGKGYKICNLTIQTAVDYDANDQHREGLFGVANGAVFRDVTLEYASVSGSRRVGTLVGHAIGTTFSACSVRNCEVSGDCYVGGMVGVAEKSTFENITVDEIALTVGKGYLSSAYSGGMVGYASDVRRIVNVSISSATPISVPKLANVGGVGGYVYGSGALVENCTSSVSVEGLKSVGVLFGQFSGGSGSRALVRNCRASAEFATGATGSNYKGIGGLVGYTTYCNYEDCEAEVENISGYTCLGGLIGSASYQCAVKRCTARSAKVSGSTKNHDKIGGLIGEATSEIEISYCCSQTGSVAGGKQVGGLLGYLSADSRVLNSWSYAESVTIIGTSDQKGSLCGYMAGVARDCYAYPEGMNALYKVSGSLVENVDAVPQSYLSCGRVTWLMNRWTNEFTWRQTLGAEADERDAWPSLSAESLPVYATGSIRCDGTIGVDISFSNIESLATNADHVMGTSAFGETGYCWACGAALPDWKPVVDGFYELNDEYELGWFRDLINRGGIHSAYSARLASDIVLTETWDPIGNYVNRHSFCGVFDGDGHSITGLQTSDAVSGTSAAVKNYQGLFGYVDGGSIRNLRIEGAEVAGKQYVGALAGIVFNSNVESCSTDQSSTVRGETRVGGIIGQVESMTRNGALVSRCTNNASVSAQSCVGGLVGYSYANGGTYDIEYDMCRNNGSVTASGQYAGGLVGYVNFHSISFGTGSNKDVRYQQWTKCVNTGSVRGTNNVGGLIGMSDAITLVSSYNYADVRGTGGNVGGLVGMISTQGGTLTHCWFDKNMGVTSPYNYAKASTIKDDPLNMYNNISIGVVARKIASTPAIVDVEELLMVLLRR